MPGKRRGGGEGSVYRDGDYWVATIEAGRHPVTGRRLRRKVKARTKAGALRKAAEARKQVDAGLGANTGATLLGDFLDWWLDTVVRNRVTSDNTMASYRGVVDQHLRPGLGATPVAKLTPEQVDRFLDARAAAGLSASYVCRMRMLLADAFRHAERRGIVARNVATLAVMPKCQPTVQRRSFTPTEARALLAAATDERLGALVVCGVVLGLRPGELTGLLWADLDLDATPPALAITGSMKRRPDSSLYRGPVKRSKAGERVLALPPVLVSALVDHRRRQAAERLAIADLWTDHGLIFASGLGTPLDAANVRRTFARVAKRAGIDAGNAPPYLMRHTAVICSGSHHVRHVRFEGSRLVPPGRQRRPSRRWPTCSVTIPRRCTATTATRYGRWPTPPSSAWSSYSAGPADPPRLPPRLYRPGACSL